jgi:(2Fe-2S) ferredoxin
MINTELDSYKKVTAEDISKVCKEYLKKDNRVVLYYLTAKK